MSVKIVLSDDNDAIRRIQRAILEADPDFEIVGEACNGQEAIRLVEQLQPDVVIMDINMPIINGFEATRKIHVSYPDVKVLGFSSHVGEAYVRGMLQAGASGYLVKPSSMDEMKSAVRAVYAGRVYVNQSMHSTLINELSKKNTTRESRRTMIVK